MYIIMCVCVCVRERKRERESARDRERERERERDRERERENDRERAQARERGRGREREREGERKRARARARERQGKTDRGQVCIEANPKITTKYTCCCNTHLCTCPNLHIQVSSHTNSPCPRHTHIQAWRSHTQKYIETKGHIHT